MKQSRRIKKRVLATGAVLLFACGATSHAGTILYTQNFENPNAGTFVNDGGDVNIYNEINTLYGGQPAGFMFAQTYTVETLLVGGTQAWGKGFTDPQNKAGQYAIAMLSDAQDDLLGLAFNVGSYKYLNFQVDVSSIDLDRWGGPFNNAHIAPTYRFSLYDNPSGIRGTGGGTLLSSQDVTGIATTDQSEFDWKNFIVALDATGNTNGNIILQINLLNGGYAALDNFVIAASDVEGEINPVPEPTTMLLFGAGIAGLAAIGRRKRD